MLDEILDELARSVNDVRAALLVDRDGMVVARGRAAGESSDESLAASCAEFMRRSAEMGREASLPEPREWILVTDDGSMLVEKVGGEYGILLLAGPQALLGQARFALRKAAHRLQPELDL